MIKRPLPFVLAGAAAISLGASVALSRGQTAPTGQTTQADVGSAISYQGQLTDSQAPARGPYDFRFKLYADPAAGAQVGETVELDDVVVDGGLFNVGLDFGAGAFDGEERYVEIGVRPGDDDGAYTTLSPLQPLAPAPYALHATSAWNLRGNANTDAQSQYLGTTDNAPLVLRTNNSEAVRIDAAGNVGIGTAPAAGMVEVDASGRGDGVVVSNSGDDGLDVRDVADAGLRVADAGGDGVQVVSAGGRGMSVESAGEDGVRVGAAVSDGVEVVTAGTPAETRDSAGSDGFEVQGAEDSGLFVGWAGANGVHVANAEGAGYLVSRAGGDGIGIGRVGGYGMSILHAQASGVFVNNATDSGAFVGTAGEDGYHVRRVGEPSANRANAGKNGFEVEGAQGHGLYVGQADGNGTYVSAADNDGYFLWKAGDPSTAQLSSTSNGVEVAGAQGSGLYVGRADVAGVYVDDAGFHGVLVDESGGSGVTVNSANIWAGYFGGNINVTGSCSGCALAEFARNASGRSLQPGETVTVRGVTSTGLTNAPVVLDVVPAAGGDVVIGVVAGRAERVTPTGGAGHADGTADQLVARPGAAPPASFLSIVVHGMAQVRASAAGRVIRPGERLVVSDEEGRAAPAERTVVQGAAAQSSGGTIGIALERADPGDELVWTLVNPR